MLTVQGSAAVDLTVADSVGSHSNPVFQGNVALVASFRLVRTIATIVDPVTKLLSRDANLILKITSSQASALKFLLLCHLTLTGVSILLEFGLEL